MEHEFKSNCLLCGLPLVYQNEAQLLTCSLCGKDARSEATCESGHYICDACHSGSANDLIENICIHSTSTMPVELATSLMNAPSIAMHGPEHHFLVPAVLITAYYNQKNDPESKTR